MPTVFSHPAVPLAIGVALGPEIIPHHLLVTGIVGSMIPDLDVVAFSFGVHSPSPFAHRGLSHSLGFAALLALVGSLGLAGAGAELATVFAFLFISIASHGILDAFTNGGSGVALLWPWSAKRYFAPFRPIAVAPISPRVFLTSRGLHVLRSEMGWVWLPCLGIGLIARNALG